MSKRSQNKEAFHKIFSIIGKKRNILILCHNNPDPDAIASAFALQSLFRQILRRKATIAYGGHIRRAENVQLIRRLKINMINYEEVSLGKYSVICLVDTQPRAGNNDLPSRVIPHIVIDHHPFRKDTARTAYHDVRPDYGSTATIITEYIISLDLEVEKRVATALFYGLKTDTNNLLRSTHQADLKAFNFLFPKVALKTLAAIEKPAVPKSYFLKLTDALENSYQYNDAIISHMGQLKNPDSVAEMAELLLRMDQIRWTLCLGEYKNQLFLSVRTSRRGWYAGTVATRVLKGIGSGGGHEKTAGGQVDLGNKSREEIESIEKRIVERFLKALNISKGKKRPLIDHDFHRDLQNILE